MRGPLNLAQMYALPIHRKRRAGVDESLWLWPHARYRGAYCYSPRALSQVLRGLVSDLGFQCSLVGPAQVPSHEEM